MTFLIHCNSVSTSSICNQDISVESRNQASVERTGSMSWTLSEEIHYVIAHVNTSLGDKWTSCTSISDVDLLSNDATHTGFSTEWDAGRYLRDNIHYAPQWISIQYLFVNSSFTTINKITNFITNVKVNYFWMRMLKPSGSLFHSCHIFHL